MKACSHASLSGQDWSGLLDHCGPVPWHSLEKSLDKSLLLLCFTWCSWGDFIHGVSSWTMLLLRFLGRLGFFVTIFCTAYCAYCQIFASHDFHMEKTVGPLKRVLIRRARLTLAYRPWVAQSPSVIVLCGSFIWCDNSTAHTSSRLISWIIWFQLALEEAVSREGYFFFFFFHLRLWNLKWTQHKAPKRPRTSKM